MKIPKQFELGGFTWTVKLVKRLKDKYGDCDLNTRTIRVKVMDTQLMEQTFCHELQHAMEVAMGHSTDDHDEVDIDKRAVFLHQFLKTAVYEADV